MVLLSAQQSIPNFLYVASVIDISRPLTLARPSNNSNLHEGNVEL